MIWIAALLSLFAVGAVFAVLSGAAIDGLGWREYLRRLVGAS